MKFEPIKVPVFNLEDSNLSVIDWKQIFFQASQQCSDFTMKAVLLHHSVVGDAKSLISALPLNEIGFNNVFNLLDHNYANLRKTLQLAVKKLLEYRPPVVDHEIQPPSITFRNVWSSVQCLVRTIENCMREMDNQEAPLSTDEILFSF